MLSRNSALKQTKRFAGLDGFPDVEEALEELIKAMQTAPSELAIDDFVEAWLNEHTVAPKPADVIQRLRPRELEFAGPPSTGCPICGGTGWVIVEGPTYSGAKPCQCRPQKKTARPP